MYNVKLKSGFSYKAKKVSNTHFTHSPSGKNVGKAIAVTDTADYTRYYHPEEVKIKKILKSNKFASPEDRLYWENKLVDNQIKQYNAKENEKVLKKAGYVGWKNWS